MSGDAPRGDIPRMRLAEICSEALRNVVTGTTRSALLMLIVACLAGLLAGLDTVTMRDEITAAAEFRARGGSISILKVDKGIDGRVCDSLASHDGVRAAGALSLREKPLHLTAVPRNPLTFYSASLGFATMLPRATGLQNAGLMLPKAVVSTLGLSAGDPLYTGEGVTRMGGSFEYPDDGRDRGLGYAAVAVSRATAGQLFDECWIDAFPVTEQTRELIYTAIAADAKLPPTGTTITQHNTTLGVATNPVARYEARLTAWAPAAALLVSALLGFVAIYMRRLAIASALHAGVRKTDQTLILVLESLSWAVVGASSTIPVIAYFAMNLAAADHATVVSTAALTPVLTVAGVVLGTLTAAALVREDKLFAYFKSR